ncbi:MAG: hypothetical protein JWN62_236 [Acidimicrobiales bacterium]|nr:hypothetical protein [Acidimicrobiales bacterium]
MRTEVLQIDVAGVLDSTQPLHTTVSVHLPDEIGPNPLVVFAFPGGGYNRTYFDLQLASFVDDDGDHLTGYSQAEHHTARGIVMVACDHLGTGDSSCPDPFSLSFGVLAAANRATVDAVLERLRKGVADGIGAILPGTVIGIGQSMGGCLLTAQQAGWRSFDAVGFLGWTNIHIQFASADGGRVTLDGAPEGSTPDEITAALLSAGEQMTYEMRRYAYHGDDEPSSLIEADLSGEPVSWRTPAQPPCVAWMVRPGATSREAAGITVPVLVAAGERDVIADVHAEAAGYPMADDVTVVRFPRMGHMHNFASSRVDLWDRLGAWYGGVRRRSDTS